MKELQRYYSFIALKFSGQIFHLTEKFPFFFRFIFHGNFLTSPDKRLFFCHHKQKKLDKTLENFHFDDECFTTQYRN